MELNFKSVAIYVKNVKKSVDFYERVFEFKRDFLDEDEIYSELSLGQAKISFIKEIFVKKHIIKNGFHINNIEKIPSGFELALTTNDVEKVFKKAVEEGAHIISKPTNDSRGYKVAYLRDFDGIIVEISDNQN